MDIHIFQRYPLYNQLSANVFFPYFSSIIQCSEHMTDKRPRYNTCEIQKKNKYE